MATTLNLKIKLLWDWNLKHSFLKKKEYQFTIIFKVYLVKKIYKVQFYQKLIKNYWNDFSQVSSVSNFQSIPMWGYIKTFETLYLNTKKCLRI